MTDEAEANDSRADRVEEWFLDLEVGFFKAVSRIFLVGASIALLLIGVAFAVDWLADNGGLRWAALPAGWMLYRWVRWTVRD